MLLVTMISCDMITIWPEHIQLDQCFVNIELQAGPDGAEDDNDDGDDDVILLLQLFPETNLVLRVRERPCKTIVLIFKSQNIDELIKVDNNLFLTCMFNRIENRTSTEGH